MINPFAFAQAEDDIFVFQWLSLEPGEAELAMPAAPLPWQPGDQPMEMPLGHEAWQPGDPIMHMPGEWL